MWCAGPQVPTVLPSLLAKPWATVSAALHMPPVLVYATYNLMNWRRLDDTQPVELGNLAVQHVGCLITCGAVFCHVLFCTLHIASRSFVVGEGGVHAQTACTLLHVGGGMRGEAGRTRSSGL